MLRIAIALTFVAACSKSAPPPANPATTAPASPEIAKDPAAARDLIAKGAVVIDVRTPAEYAGGHLDASTNVPIEDLPQRLPDVDQLVGGDKSKPVVVHCARGGRAQKAKTQLEAAGYTNVVNGGGYDDLK
jgi:phage shock protein E